MKLTILIILLTITSSISAQYTQRLNKECHFLLQQSDSIYKINKVKSRITYRVGENYSNKFTFNNEGKVVAILFPPKGNYWELNTVFNYDIYGRITNIRDVYTKSKNNKFYSVFVKGDKELEAKFDATPNNVFINYELFFRNDTITKILRKSEVRKVNTESYYSNKGLKQVFIDKDEYPTSFICEFVPKNTFQNLLSIFEYNETYGKKIIKYEYAYGENNQFITKMIVREYLILKGKPEDYKTPFSNDEYVLEYNKVGLLVKVSRRGYSVYEYRYEYF